MANVGDIKVSLTADTSSFTKSLKLAQTSLQSLGKSFTAIKSPLAGIEGNQNKLAVSSRNLSKLLDTSGKSIATVGIRAKSLTGAFTLSQNASNRFMSSNVTLGNKLSSTGSRIVDTRTKLESFGSSVVHTGNSVVKLKTPLDSLGTSQIKLTSGMKSVRSCLNLSTGNMNKMKTSATSLSGAFVSSQGSVSKFSSGTTILGSRLEGAGSRLNTFKSRLASIGPSLSSARIGVTGFSTGLKSLIGAGAIGMIIAGLGTVIGYTSRFCSWLKQAALATIEAGAASQKWADGLGITVKEAAMLKKEFSLLDIDPSAPVKQLLKLDKAVLSSSTKGSALTRTLNEFNVKITDSAGKLLPVNVQLDNLAVAYNKAKKSGDQGRLAVALFGARAQTMLPILENYSLVKERASKISGVGIDTKAAQEASINLKALSMQWKAIKLAAGKALIPIINSLLPKLQNILSKVASGLAEGGLLGAIKKVFGEDTAKLVSNIGTILKSFGAIIKFLSPLFKLLFRIIADNVESVVNDVTKAIDVLKKVFMFLRPPVMAIVNTIKSGFNIAATVIQSIVRVIINVKNKLMGLFPSLPGLASNAIDKVKGFISGISIIIQRVKGVLRDMFPGLPGLASNAIDKVKGFINGISTIIQRVKGVLRGMFSGLPGVASTEVTKVKTTVTGISGTVTRVKSTILSLFSGLPGVASTEVGKVKTTIYGIKPPIAIVRTKLLSLFSGLPGVASTEVGKVKTSVSGIKSPLSTVRTKILSLFSGLSGSASTAVSKVKTSVSGISSSTVPKVKSVLNGMFSDLPGLASTAVSKVKTAINGISSTVTRVKGVLSGMSSGVAYRSTVIKSNFSSISNIPKFATGGIVNKPTIGLIGEAGPEAVIPLSKLSSIQGNNSKSSYVINITGNTISSALDINRIGDMLVKKLRQGGLK